MDKYYILIKHIKSCNLSDSDKQTLIDILSKDEVDLNSFVLAFLRLLQIGATISKLFDIDIGD